MSLSAGRAMAHPVRPPARAGAGARSPIAALPRLRTAAAALAEAARMPVIEARRVLPAGRGRIALLGALAVLAALLAPSLAGRPETGSGSALGSGIGLDPVDLLGKAILVAALLYVVLRVLRRVQSGPAIHDARLVVLESRTLAPKATLYLVAVGDRRVVIGLTPGGLTALAELEADELPSAGVPLLMTAPERAVR